MNCEIKRNGYLFLYAETEIEAYALRKWSEHNAVSVAGLKIIIDTRLPHERKETEE